MMGTLATGLAKRKITTLADRYSAYIEGEIEDIDGVLRISRIRVNYDLKVSPGKAEDAQEVFATYLKSCPAAMSVIGCIDIIDQLDITEIEVD